jgi:uncharacterized protein
MGGLIRLLVFVIAIWLIVFAVRRLLLPPSVPRRDKEEGKEPEGMLLIQDPQCGRFVPERDAVSASVRGQLLHFCSQECRDLYVAALKPPTGKKNRE